MKNHHPKAVVFHIMTMKTITHDAKFPTYLTGGEEISGANAKRVAIGGIDYSLIVHHLQQECKKKITPTSKKSEGWKRKEMKKSVYGFIIHHQYQ